MYSLYWIRGNCKPNRRIGRGNTLVLEVLFFFLFTSSWIYQKQLWSVVATTAFFRFSLPVDISFAFATSIFLLYDPTIVVWVVLSESGLRLLVFPFLYPLGSLYTSGASCSATFFPSAGEDLLKYWNSVSTYCAYGISITVCALIPSWPCLRYSAVRLTGKRDTRGTCYRQMSARSEPICNQSTLRAYPKITSAVRLLLLVHYRRT